MWTDDGGVALYSLTEENKEGFASITISCSIESCASFLPLKSYTLSPHKVGTRAAGGRNERKSNGNVGTKSPKVNESEISQRLSDCVSCQAGTFHSIFPFWMLCTLHTKTISTHFYGDETWKIERVHSFHSPLLLHLSLQTFVFSFSRRMEFQECLFIKCSLSPFPRTLSTTLRIGG